MRLISLLACSAVLSTAQTTITKRVKPMGSAQLEVSSSGVNIQYGGEEWKVDLSSLPITPDDCEDPDARPQCAEHGKISCLPCIREWESVAWDEPRRIFYLAGCTGPGQNRTWIILSYNLRTRKLKRLVSEYGGGFDGNGVTSSSGRYLAYVTYGVCGVCCTRSKLAVVDTQTKMSGSYDVPTADTDQRARITGVRWSGLSTIEYDAEIHLESECDARTKAASRQVSGHFDVTEIHHP